MKNIFIPSMAHTIKSRLKKGKNVVVKEIREMYGDKIVSMSDDDVQSAIDKMYKKVSNENSNNKKKQEVVMSDKPVFDKEAIKSAINDCLKSGECDSFNTLSHNIDLNNKELKDVKSSVQEGCSKLSSIDDLKNKIDKQNSIIASLSNDKNKNEVNKENDKGRSDVDKLALAALRTFSSIRSKESELSNGIRSLIDINKKMLKPDNIADHKLLDDNINEDVNVNDKKDVDVNDKKDVDVNDKSKSNEKDDFVTLDEALKHKELRGHILNKIINNDDMKNSLIDKLIDGNNNISNTKDVIGKVDKVVEEVKNSKKISVLKKLIGKL